MLSIYCCHCVKRLYQDHPGIVNNDLDTKLDTLLPRGQKCRFGLSNMSAFSFPFQMMVQESFVTKTIAFEKKKNPPPV